MNKQEMLEKLVLQEVSSSIHHVDKDAITVKYTVEVYFLYLILISRGVGTAFRMICCSKTLTFEGI